MKFDKSKTTSLEDFDSQLDWMVDNGVLKSPQQFKKDMSNGVVDFYSYEFNKLSKKEQKIRIEFETNRWWKQYGK